MLTGRQIEEAKREIETKTVEEIEVETARKWAARAVAYYNAALNEAHQNSRIALQTFLNGYDAHQEAIEHAAKGGADYAEETIDYLGDVLESTLKTLSRR